MTIAVWLKHTELTLQSAGITTARLDALVLLADEMERDKSWVLAHPEYVLQIEQVEKLHTKITQRAAHTPLAYIRGHAEFYGREFIVNKHVLVPRPESESIIELLKSTREGSHSSTIIDVGTGSGALAITAKLETPATHVIGIDVSKDCLEVARSNAEKLNAAVTFLYGDLLHPIQHMQDVANTVILANLPYVPEDHPINDAAKHEPSLALFGGKDGLDLYRTLFSQSAAMSTPPSTIITESLPAQHQMLTSIARQAGFSLRASEGLAQLFTGNTT